MTFISFAQNFEDVMLWRALGHVENGFYIDAGAWSPDEDSVTRAFYERGWRGINIEPNPTWFDLLREKRAEDINLPFALSDKEGRLDLHVVVGTTGLSTTDAEFAEKNREAGRSVQTIPCQAVTLNRLWEEHIGEKQVHFLKVDVEGAEERVLRGNDWTKNRPWVVLVESVYPNTKDSTYHVWEHFLLDANYVYAYSDGINRYYVGREHADLLSAFENPPNIFDDFKLSAHAQADADRTALSYQNEELSRQFQELSRQYQDLEIRHSLAVNILSEISKTRVYRWARKLGKWAWLEEQILRLNNMETENKESS